MWRWSPAWNWVAAAIATLSAVSAVIGSALAVPRMPSVPKSLRVMALMDTGTERPWQMLPARPGKHILFKKVSDLLRTNGGRSRHHSPAPARDRRRGRGAKSEEHTSELQSLMRISYAVFCLKKKQTIIDKTHNTP